MTTPDRLTELTAAVDDQPMWAFNEHHAYAHRLHGRHLAVLQATTVEVMPDYRFSVRDVLTGHATVHGTRSGPAWALLEEMNVALTSAERANTT